MDTFSFYRQWYTLKQLNTFEGLDSLEKTNLKIFSSYGRVRQSQNFYFENASLSGVVCITCAQNGADAETITAWPELLHWLALAPTGFHSFFSVFNFTLFLIDTTVACFFMMDCFPQ